MMDENNRDVNYNDIDGNDIHQEPVSENQPSDNILSRPTVEVLASSGSSGETQKGSKNIFVVLAAAFAVAIAIIISVLLFLGNGVGSGSLGHRHSYGDWETISYATCSTPGEKERYCECGEKQTSVINRLAHEYDAWEIVREATCVSMGLKERECACGEKESASIAKTSHSLFETVSVVATSTSQGTKTIACENCSYTSATTYSASILSSEEIYELAELSVGEISIYNKSGSEIALGTIVVHSSDGKLLTNYHVIDGTYSAKVTLAGKTYTVNSVLAYDKDIDLAVLKINAINLSVPVIQTEGIRGGSKVYAVGSSEGYTLSFSTGVIASPSRIIDGVEYIQHEAAISHGNSGGPLFNEYGEVIGINTLSNIEGQNLNFAIACNEIENLNFGTPLTMRQFYEKECDVFEKLKNYIIENGSRYNDYYRVLLGNTYSSDYSSKYSRYAYYYIDDDEITLDLIINDGEYWVYFTIDNSVDGSYSWKYFDDADYEMRGTLYASTYDSDTLLGYSYNNISYSSLRTSVRELASSMVSLLCLNIDYDFREIGVTAEDLHFYYY